VFSISSILMRIPLMRTIYRYFGGSLELVSLDGWGEHHYAQLEWKTDQAQARTRI
jgi:hypothetical protein